nr:MAG TPA: hypothetical protein [Caudoviricetes sp.]
MNALTLTATEARNINTTRIHRLDVGQYFDLPQLFRKLEEFEPVWDEDSNQMVNYGWSFHDQEKTKVSEIPMVGDEADLYVSEFFSAGYWLRIRRVSDCIFQVVGDY